MREEEEGIKTTTVVTIRDILRIFTIRKLIFHHVSLIHSIVSIIEDPIEDPYLNQHDEFVLLLSPPTEKLQVAKGTDFNHVQLVKALRFGRNDLFFKHFNQIYHPNHLYYNIFDIAVATNNHPVMQYFLDIHYHEQLPSTSSSNQMNQPISKLDTYDSDDDDDDNDDDQSDDTASSLPLPTPTAKNNDGWLHKGEIGHENYRDYRLIQKKTIELLCKYNINIHNRRYGHNCLKKLISLADVDLCKRFLAINSHIKGAGTTKEYSYWSEACKRGLPCILEIIQVVEGHLQLLPQILWNNIMMCSLIIRDIQLFKTLLEHVIGSKISGFILFPTVLSKTCEWKELLEYIFVNHQLIFTYQQSTTYTQLVKYKNIEGLKYFHSRSIGPGTNQLLQLALQVGCMECTRFILDSVNPPNYSTGGKWTVYDIKFGSNGDLIDIDTLNILTSHPNVDFKFCYCLESSIKGERMDLYHRLNELAHQKLISIGPQSHLLVNEATAGQLDKSYIDIMGSYMIALQTAFWNREIDIIRSILSNHPPPRVAPNESTSQVWLTSKYRSFEDNLEFMHSHGLLSISVTFNQTIINHSFYKGFIKPLQYFGLRKPSHEIATKVLKNAFCHANYDFIIYLFASDNDSHGLTPKNNLYQNINNHDFGKEEIQDTMLSLFFTNHRQDEKEKIQNTLKISDFLIKRFGCEITMDHIVCSTHGESHEIFGYLLEKSIEFKIPITKNDIYLFLKYILSSEESSEDKRLPMLQTLFNFVENHPIQTLSSIRFPPISMEFIKFNHCQSLLLLLDRFKFNNHKYSIKTTDPPSLETEQQSPQHQLLYSTMSDQEYNSIISKLHINGSSYLIHSIQSLTNK